MSAVDQLAYAIAALAGLLGLGLLWRMWSPSRPSSPRRGAAVASRLGLGPGRTGRAADAGTSKKRGLVGRWRRIRTATERSLDEILDRARGEDAAISRAAMALARELRELADEVERDRLRGRSGGPRDHSSEQATEELLAGLDTFTGSLDALAQTDDVAAFDRGLDGRRRDLRRLRLGYHLGPDALEAAIRAGHEAADAAATASPTSRGQEVGALEKRGPAAADAAAPASRPAWVPETMAKLGELHRDVIHVLKNKLAAAQRYQDDPERFLSRFYRPATVEALRDRLLGEHGLLVRLTALTPRLIDAPELPDSSPLASLVSQVLGLRRMAEELGEHLEHALREGPSEDAQEEVRGAHAQIQRFAELFVESDEAHGLDALAVARELAASDVDAELTVEVREGEARVHALDPAASNRHLEELFTNTFQNAMHAGASRVRVSVRHEADLTVLSIEDDGPGMESEVLEKVRRGRHSSKDAGGGTGLQQVRRVAEELGGRLVLGSSELGGLALCLELPRV